MRVNDITNSVLHVAQCSTFNQTKCVTATLIAKASLESLYSRLDLKVIKKSAASPNFEKARKLFHYKSVKSKAFQKSDWITMLSNHPTTSYNYL